MHTLLEHKLHPYREVFQHPKDRELQPFTNVLDHVYSLKPQRIRDGETAYTAAFEFRGKSRHITVMSRNLQIGPLDQPELIYSSWYGGSSSMTRKLLNDGKHPDWYHKGIELFQQSSDNFNTPYFSAEGAQYAYALGMRMTETKIKQAHARGVPVGLVCVSFGANVASAVLATSEEKPDAIVEVEGGSMSDLGPKMTKKSDQRTLEIIKNEGLLPSQAFSVDLRERVFAVVNETDETSYGQTDVWGPGDLVIAGSHFKAPFTHRKEIREKGGAHLDRYL